MKLASLKHERDGKLIIVSRDLTRFCRADDIAPTLQHALDHWDTLEASLRARYDELNHNHCQSEEFKAQACASPLPRAYHWADGSAYVNHVELVRQARGASMPESFWTDPLMYQGGSDAFLGPYDDIEIEDERWGIDFEAEVAVVTDDVPMACTASEARSHIKLIMLVNDVSLRNLIPGELAKGFGFYHAKPSSAFSPVAITPNELGSDWSDGKVHLPLHAILNEHYIGSPNAGIDMTFNFDQLIAHAAKSRSLCAGTIIGSGTVSNKNRSHGSCCLAEVRMLEKIHDDKVKTEFMKFGDIIQIEMRDREGENIFGQIKQTVKPYVPKHQTR